MPHAFAQLRACAGVNQGKLPVLVDEIGINSGLYAVFVLRCEQGLEQGIAVGGGDVVQLVRDKIEKAVIQRGYGDAVAEFHVVVTRCLLRWGSGGLGVCNGGFFGIRSRGGKCGAEG